MNRLFAPPKKSSVSRTRVDQAVMTAPRGHSTYSLLAPLHYEANYAYPVVVWLHSDGGDEKQLLRVMQHISMRNYVGLGVRGSLPCEGRRGYQWQQSPASIITAENRVQEAIAAAQAKFNVNSDRIFLAGHEAGGTMAFRLALRSPRNYAGALSVGGRFPLGQMPLLNLHSLRDLPLFLAYCRDSETYTEGDLCDELPLFHAAALKVAIRQYPCGDELTTQMLADMDAWMMERVTGVPSHSEESATVSRGQWN
ncbi:MAG: alpha/beta hydrolase [Pirellulaceae bacterium]